MFTTCEASEMGVMVTVFADLMLLPSLPAPLGTNKLRVLRGRGAGSNVILGLGTKVRFGETSLANERARCASSRCMMQPEDRAA